MQAESINTGDDYGRESRGILWWSDAILNHREVMVYKKLVHKKSSSDGKVESVIPLYDTGIINDCYIYSRLSCI